MLRNLTHTLVTMLVANALLSCGKQKPIAPSNQNNGVLPPQVTVASKSVNWNSNADGVYTVASAKSDMGDIIGTWRNADIFSNTVKIKIPSNTLSSGNIVNIDVADGTEYELSFKVRFGSTFEWSRGGKVGFGFHIGNGFTGCNKADDGTGGTARLMWYNPNGTKTSNSVNDAPYFRPYVYYKDMPEDCGNSFGKQSVRLNKNQWYTVKIRVKSNSGTATDGNVLYEIDGVPLLSQAIRWTTNDAYRKIKEITFHTFRGGSDEYWQSTTDGDIYYDDLTWTKIAD
ncbi:polysaccharide lyase [Mucilaginibacter sp. PAMB04168]|uniref:polysaccharide lyase n=1 Tax=Mucilaginibacter sp. PAMB04168 TaxID=3138567 RepID=UPI0031F65107